MTGDLNTSKAALRKQTRAALQNISPERRAAASAAIQIRLREQAIWQRAKSVLLFAPLPGEVDVWPLLDAALAAGKVAALPRFDSRSQSYVAGRVQQPQNEIILGQFGIREPAAGCLEILPGDLDLILVPAVAFDPAGRRLGRGKGFYDRLLACVRGIKGGTAFDEQMVNAVPVETRDIRMDFIVTPTRWIET